MLNVLEKGLKIRAVEEQLLEGYRNRSFGGTVHTCIGQEILPSVLSEVLSNDPFVISNHRGHGHFIAHTGDVKGLFCEFLAKEGAPSKGIGGSQHLYSDNFLSNGIQGCTSPFAVGIGLSRPTVIYMGDGTLGVGTVYEALNLAQLTSSKTMFVVEDNEISQTTPSREVLSGSITKRFEAFDIFCIEIDSADPESMFSQLEQLEGVWNKYGVVALIVKSYRLNSHSKGDDTRPEQAIRELPDPLKILARQVGVEFELVAKKQRDLVSKTWQVAMNSPDESYRSSSRSRIRKPFVSSEGKGRVNEHIRLAIAGALNDGALFIGEDIVTKWHDDDLPYSGAFGVSLGLSEQFDNVVGTSISEAGIVGLAAGHAFASEKMAIAEIMFADFATLIVDQLHNGVDKYKKMFGQDVKIPLVVRLPYGMGRGYGPTHSQSPFELFSGLTETSVISYNPLIDYQQLLSSASKFSLSLVIFEPKVIYGDRVDLWMELLVGFSTTSIPGRVVGNLLVQTSNNPKVVLLTHGGVTHAVLKSVKENNIEAQVLVVNELYSDLPYLEFLNGNLPVVVIEESNSDYGALWVSVSEEISSISRKGKVIRSKPVKNTPSNTKWEKELIIDEDAVMDLIDEVLL